MDNQQDNNQPSVNRVPTTPDSQSQQPAPYTATLQPPKKSKTPLILTLIIIIILLFIIGGGAYYLLVANKTASPAVTQKTATTAAPAQTAADIVATIKKLAFKGTIAPIVKSDALSAQTTSEVPIYNSYPYQTTGKQFANDPIKNIGMGTTGSATLSAADYATLVGYLTSHGFKETQQPPAAIDDPGNVQNGLYLSDSILCYAQQYDWSKDVGSAYPKESVTSINCADLSSYQQNATVLEPFYQALTADAGWNKSVNPSIKQPLYLSDLKINSGANGAKNASVGIAYVGAPFGVGEGLFYQQAGKAWTYLLVTQDRVMCKDLASTVIQQAFVGQQCYNTTSQKMVDVSTLLK